jgi:hypothetical protein
VCYSQTPSDSLHTVELWRARLIYRDALRYRVVLEINDSLNARVNILEDKIETNDINCGLKLSVAAARLSAESDLTKKTIELKEYWRKKSRSYKWQRNGLILGAVIYAGVRIFKPP